MSLLTDAQFQIEQIYAKHSIALDLYHHAGVYDPATSAATDTSVAIVVRAYIEGAEALRAFVTSDAMIEEFSRVISVPAVDCIQSGSSFFPSTGDKVEWRSASVRAVGEAAQNYRVLQVFPRMVNETPIAFLMTLRNS